MLLIVLVNTHVYSKSAVKWNHQKATSCTSLLKPLSSGSALRIAKTAERLRDSFKKKKREQEYPGGFLTVEYNKKEFGKYYTEI